MTRVVVFSPEEVGDIEQIDDRITDRDGPARAWSFVSALTDHCEGFALFPERGTRRDDLRPGLRVVGLRRRVTIAFHVTDDAVVIDRLLYAGRDLAAEIDAEPS